MADHHLHKEDASSQEETELESKCLRQLHSSDRHYHNTADTIRRLRLLCLFHGAHGLLDLGRLFRKLDDNGKKKIVIEEFIAGLNKAGLERNDGEAESLFRRLDHDNNGKINVGEFLAFIRPTLSPSRLEIIEKAFKKLDKESKGLITLDVLRRGYNVKSSTKYITGEESEEDMVKKFLTNFEHGAIDNKITHEEFLNYYSAISSSIDDDCFFDLMMRQAYKL